MSGYKVEVRVGGDAKYCGNMLVFGSEAEARAYARNLAGRWVLVDDWRVVPCDEPVNAKWPGGRHADQV